MDEGLSHAVTEVFVRLHEEGLIYRGKRLVNWDPVLHTALSDLEVLAEPEQGQLVASALSARGRQRVISSSRRRVRKRCSATPRSPCIPTTSATGISSASRSACRSPTALIPIIADEYVDPAFGSGCVKITPGPRLQRLRARQAPRPAADQHLRCERRAQRRGARSSIAASIGSTARKRVVADLEALGLVEKIEPHTLQVPRGDRSGAVLEPWLTDQWYVRIAPLAEPAIKAVEDGRIRFVPENWAKTYFQWMHNIQDWCISRQLWWGHQIPAWYDEQGNIYVARSEAEAQAQARAKLGRDVDADARRGRARHVVLLRAVAVLDARLAGADAGAEDVLSDQRARDRLRHHLLLGRAHDHDGPEVRRRRAVPRGLHHRADPRRARRQDVQVEGQHHRPARPDRRHRPRVAGRQAHQRADAAAPDASKIEKNTRKQFPQRHSGATAPTRCASRSARSRRWAATSASISAASTATRTSATSCGTPRATC